MSIFDNNIFGGDFGPSPSQQLQQQVPSLTPDEEQSLLSKIGSTALHGLGWVGGTMDKSTGARAIRAGANMLMGRDTPASELLSFLPFSDTLGITDPEHSVSGAELVGNKEADFLSPHGIGGLAAEIALDPTTYLSFGGKALTALGEKALKAGIKVSGGGARAAGLTGDLAQQLAKHAGVPVSEVAGKSLGGHIGVGLPFMGNSMTFDLTKPLAAAGAAFDTIPGSSFARQAVNKADELTKPLRTGFASLFEGAVKGKTVEEVQNAARAATGAAPGAIYENLGHMVPINEELARMAGYTGGVVTPQVEEAAKQYGKQFRLAVERTPSPLDEATKAILANTPANILQAAQAGHGPIAPEILDAVAKAKHFDDVTAFHKPVMDAVDPRIKDLAVRTRQMLDAQLAAENKAGYMTQNIHKNVADPNYLPRASVQGETGHIPGGGKTVQFSPEDIMARDPLIGQHYAEGPGSINWLTGTPEGQAIAAMTPQDAKQEVLKKMLGWTQKEANDFVDLSNRNFATMSPADEARFTELFKKTQPVATTAPATDELFHILSYKDPSKSVPEAINVLQGGSMRPIDTWSYSAQHGPAAQRWNANAATNTVSLVYDRPALEAAGQQAGRTAQQTVNDRLGIAKVFNPNAPKYDPALTKVVFKGDQASLEFAAVQKAVDDLNLKRQSFGLQPVELATPYQAMQPKVTWSPAPPLSNMEANEFKWLSQKKSGPGLTAEETARLGTLTDIQEKADKLVNWQRGLDLPALLKTEGFFGNSPMADLQRHLESRAVNRVNAEEVYKAIPKLVTTDPTGAVPVMDVMKKAGLNYELLDPAVRGAYLPEKAAQELTTFVKPATVQEGLNPWLNLVDSITNLTKAAQTSWPATQMRNVLSDIYNRFAYGGSPIKPLFDAKAFREGQVIPGAAKRLGLQGLDDAAATKLLQQESFRLNLLDTKKFQAMEAAGIDPTKQTIQRNMQFIGAPMPGLGESLKQHIPTTWTQFNPLETRGVGGRQESKFFPVGAAQAAQNYSEEMNRLGTYLDARMRGYSPIAAFDQVTKAHLDFSNLAPFEKSFMRRAVPFYCVPETAEILTRDGWKTCDQLVIGEEVMTYNQSGDYLEWQPCQDKAIFEHNQSLMHFETTRGKSFDFTPEHRWPVRQSRMIVKRHYGKYVYPEESKVVTGDKLRGQHSFIQTAQFLGTESILTVDQARLLGWVMTDGYFRFRRGGCEVVLFQHPNKFLKEVKAVAGGKPRAPHPDTGTITVPVLHERVQEIRKFLDKDRLIEVVTRLSRPAAEAMFDAMYKADGTVAESRKGDYFGKQHPGIRAAFRVLALMLGKTTTESEDGCYISKQRYLKLQSGKMTWKHYHGRVWCPRTANGTWVMKQGTTIVLSGNSWSRQNLPNIVSEMATNPGGRMRQTMRTFNAATDTGFLPDQISQTGYAIPVGADEEGKRNYLTGLGLPFEDLANLTSIKNMLGTINPFVRVPFELATGTQTYSGQHLPNAFPLEGSPTANALLMNSPLSRILSTYRTGQRGYDTGNYVPAALQFFAGPRITSVDNRAAARQAVNELAAQQFGSSPMFSQFERFNVRPGQMPNLTPQQLELLMLYRSVNRPTGQPKQV